MWPKRNDQGKTIARVLAQPPDRLSALGSLLSYQRSMDRLSDQIVRFDINPKRITKRALQHIDTLYQAWRCSLSSGGANGTGNDMVTAFLATGRQQHRSSLSSSKRLLTIADDASDPTNGTTASSSTRKWGHFADHKYSCNASYNDTRYIHPIGSVQMGWGEAFIPTTRAPCADGWRDRRVHVHRRPRRIFSYGNTAIDLEYWTQDNPNPGVRPALNLP
ncbi:MAG: hypothetical protein R2873_22490 [Caldilineaceae bacterium]